MLMFGMCGAAMMNFHEYNGPYRQYVQMLDHNLNILGNNQGIEVDSNGDDQKFFRGLK